MQETSGVADTDLNRSARLPSALDLVTDRLPASFYRSSSSFRTQLRATRSFGVAAFGLCALRRSGERGMPAIPCGSWLRRGIMVHEI